MNSTFVWYDLSANEIESAIGFYSGLMGWGTEKWDGPVPYTMFKRGDKTFGGVMPLADEARKMGAPPNWMGYVAVADVDAAAAKAKTLGGQVYVPGTDIPKVGRFAVLADPTGAVIAVFSTDQTGGGMSSARSVAWHELSTQDPDAAWRFYEAMFGWKKTESMEMPGGGTYQMFKADGGDALGGMSKMPPNMPMSAWVYYFACTDARGTFAKAKEMGCKPIYEPMQVPGGGWATLLVDPQGAAFGLFSME